MVAFVPLALTALCLPAAPETASLACSGAPDARSQRYVAQRSDSHAARRALRLLEPERLSGRKQDEVVTDLAAIGPDAVPALFAMLSGTLEGPEDGGVAPALADGEAGPEGLRTDDVLIAALARFPAARVSACVAAACRNRPGPGVRTVGLRVLAEMGDAQAVDAWIEILSELKPIQLAGVRVEAPAVDALARILERDPAALDRLAARLRGVSVHLAPLVARSVGACGRARGVDVLLALLGRGADCDLVVLRQIGELSATSAWGLSDEPAARIRAYLADPSVELRCEAARALGRACDSGSVDALVGVLSAPDADAASAAAWALRRMSGRDFPADPAPWRDWWMGEQKWMDRDAPGRIAALADPDLSRATEAARDICQRPVFRHPAAEAVSRLLASADPARVGLACEALVSLGSMRALGPLAEALGRSEDAVRAASYQALVRLTGRNLPPVREAWTRALGI